MKNIFVVLSLMVILPFQESFCGGEKLKLNNDGYFEARGLNVLVFNNWYDGNFSDAKMSSVEMIHHGIRTVTNGDVRLSPTPEQWDPVPKFVDRKINIEENSIEAFLTYPEYKFDYSIKVTTKDDGILITVNISNILPKELEGKAGFNLEFLPSAYFEKSFMIDNDNDIFPLYPSSEMFVDKNGVTNPVAIAKGKKLILAPEDPENNISIEAHACELSLFDGRNKAQNGWFVVRTLIPSNQTGTVIEWFVKANTIPGWTRKPVIEYSQVGYSPAQKKVAMIEFDKNEFPKFSARLLKANDSGKFEELFKGKLIQWGSYLRYNYNAFDFSAVSENGLYIIEYDTIKTKPFRIAKDVYSNAWQPTLDIFFPVQMDHMFVNEAYRVWHGAAHLDDALQAPVNHEHFDLYAQGPTTDSPYKPGEHIPGLNVGGWFDAGDFDIRTQTQYSVVLNLVHTWESFGLKRDETTIDQNKRYVDMHHPDGIPDLIQQIEHGTLQLLAQHKSVGHAIPGIIVSDLSQYTHLGDASTITDNLIFNPNLKPMQSDGYTSGTFDDRWAFTSKSTPLNYGSIAALAAAGRALTGYNDSLANDCLTTAVKVWDDEHSHKPDMFRYGNTTGGQLEAEELKAAVELLFSTKDRKYAERINELLPEIENRFEFYASMLVEAMPFMDQIFHDKIESLVIKYSENLKVIQSQNPFCVPITTRGWAGNGAVVNFAITNYILHKAFPQIINKESALVGLNYIFGCHPGSNISFVSGVGTHSKKIAYGNNRADFSFIAGGVVPGVLILKPNFPENKEDWPFLWGENEYVVNLASSYIYLVNAANELVSE